MPASPHLKLVAGTAVETPTSATGVLVSVDDDGTLRVHLAGERRCRACRWLETGQLPSVQLKPGDSLLVQLGIGGRPVVLGRIGRYRPPQAGGMTLQAQHMLKLQCGDSSLTLRADGKILLKGDDVVVRAKGTQRFRAGHVAIN
jgi:hypothetical protein